MNNLEIKMAKPLPAHAPNEYTSLSFISPNAIFLTLKDQINEIKNPQINTLIQKPFETKYVFATTKNTCKKPVMNSLLI